MAGVALDSSAWSGIIADRHTAAAGPYCRAALGDGLAMATSLPARAAGLSAGHGRLRQVACADIALIERESLQLQPRLIGGVPARQVSAAGGAA
jgi:cytosine/adenosine deaminase-related metal-dependent hydrolase